MRIVAFLVVALVVTVASAAAQERKVGDSIAYDVRISGSGPSQSAPLVLKLDRVDAGGDAHASASYTMQRGQAATFGVTLSSAGEIRPPLDTDLRPHRGMSNAEIMAMSGAATGDMLLFMLRPFNTFAAACGARALRAGDTWHAQTSDPPQIDFIYRVTRIDNRAGHTLVDVGMQSAPGATIDMSGTGTYDVTAHLVSSFRSEWTSGQQSQVTELTLKP